MAAPVSSPGDICDATGALIVKGARVPAGAAAGSVVTSDAAGNLSLQPSAGGGGAVASVFTRTGAVTAQSGDYTAAQVGADASGLATAAQAAAIAASLQKAGNLSDLASAATARTNLGLGSSAVQPAIDVIVATATGTYATDVASINAAVTAAGTGGIVYFPPGTYTADGLAPLSGQLWYGPATIIRPNASTASVVAATGLSGFTMRWLTVDGNQANSTATTAAAVYLTNSTWCQLDKVTVQNTPSANAAVILRGAVRCIIDACQISNVGYGVLLGLNHGDAYSCYGNLIRGCTIDTTANDAIFLTENLGSTGSVSVTGSVIATVVTGCTVRDFGDCGIEIGSGSVFTEVSGCTFDGISNGTGNNGILFRDAAHSNVTGCTVSNLTKTGATGVYAFNLNGANQHNSVNNVDVYNTGYGYIVNGGPGGGVIGTAATDIAFNGGIIDTTALDGIHLANVNGFSITGTQVRNAGGQGISVGGFGLSGSGCQDGTITGARIFNSSQVATGNSGIILFQATADITITGCRIGDNQGTKTQKYGVNVFDSTVTNVYVNANDLNGNLTAAFNSNSSVANGISYQQPASGQYLCAPSQYAPGTITTLSTTSATLSAVSSANVNTGAFTAPASGNVLVTAYGIYTGSSADNVSFALSAHGTVTPVVGTVITGSANSSANSIPCAIPFLIAGLTPGTSYSLDLLFAISAAGTLAFKVIGQSSTTPTGTLGAPLVMTVQAV
jgi:hypothetical protein